VNEAIYKQPLVLFLGAGASKPLGLKTTPEFWEWFRFDSGFDWNLLNAIAESIEPSEEIGRKPDIEAVLDILEKISEGKELEEKISNSTSFKYSKYAKVLETKPTVPEGKITEFIKPILVWWDISERIKDLVIEHYFQVDNEQAFKLYQPLLELALHRPLPIFTTNYDRAVEKAYESTIIPTYDIRKAPYNLVDGFSRERIVTPIWSRSAYDDFMPTGADVILFKLHGSVNWVRTPEGIQRVDIPQRDLGGAPTVIAYPSRLKREIHEEPFRTNYDYLIACLLHAEVCVVIGFSFRDQEIVEEFRQAMQLNKKLGLLIINPDAEAINAHLKTKFGFDPKPVLINREFTAENAQPLADNIKRYMTWI
jgi:hypothetical protein